MNLVVSIYIACILLIFTERKRKIKLEGSSLSKGNGPGWNVDFFVWRGQILVLIY